jgi:hypothetical protein
MGSSGLEGADRGGGVFGEEDIFVACGENEVAKSGYIILFLLRISLKLFSCYICIQRHHRDVLWRVGCKLLSN